MRFRLALFLLLAAAAPVAASVQSGLEKWRAEDWDGAVADWVGPASRGDAEAMFNMGQAHRMGRGVPQNSEVAIDYYRRAADKGHVGAMTNLGITLYQEGRKTEALNQLRQAADKGDMRAAYVLGVATFGGDGAPRNPALGYAYVVRARDSGLSVASAQAARMATLMSADDRARGEATAAALASGKPVAVVLAELSAPKAAEPVVLADAGAATAADTEDEAEEADTPAPARKAAPEKAPARAAEKPAAKGAEKSADKKPAKAQAEKSANEAPAAKADARAEAEGFKVQLGAYANESAARTAWATLVSQSAELLKGRKPIYSPRGNLVRLQVGPYPDRGDAAELCTKLAAAGRPCFVTR